MYIIATSGTRHHISIQQPKDYSSRPTKFTASQTSVNFLLLRDSHINRLKLVAHNDSP